MSNIVFIGAVGRSGTTLLERTLATSPHTVALGEMVHLWDRGVGADETCGCGVAFSACPFWSEVGRRAFGGWQRVDLDELSNDRRAVDRNRYIPFLIAPRMAPTTFRAARQRLLDTLARLYETIDEVASEQQPGVVLIDSSKHPSYLFLLRGLRSPRLCLLHVVRDPRGVANSWSKRIARPENGNMERVGTVRAIVRWTSHNLLFHLAGRLGVPHQRMSYERFTADPLELGRRFDQLLTQSGNGSSDPVSLAIDADTVTLGVDHTVSGNPMRFSSGTTQIRSDDSWRTSMSRRRQLTIGILTTPLRQVYAR